MSFPRLKNDRFLRAARGQETDQVPVWLMRQAGRYLPEFRDVRSKHDFFTICQTPELAAEVTLQPIRRFPLDAAIIFSDILVIPQALGMIVEMKSGVGPVLPSPLQTPDDIGKLEYPVNVNERLKYVADAITLTRHKLDGEVPLIGFSGAPWTLMAYMIEGGGSKTLSKGKAWLYKYPSKSKYLLEILTNVVIDYLVMQAEGGAQLLQVFESSAEHLDYELFVQFCIPCLQDICSKVKNILKSKKLDVPMTIFAKGAHYALYEISKCGYDVMGIDWTVNPAEVRKIVGSNITLQGNLDPCALYAPDDTLVTLSQEMVKKFGTQRYIANLGHGIYPDMDPEKVKVFIDTVHTCTTNDT